MSDLPAYGTVGLFIGDPTLRGVGGEWERRKRRWRRSKEEMEDERTS